MMDEPKLAEIDAVYDAEFKKAISGIPLNRDTRRFPEYKEAEKNLSPQKRKHVLN